MTEPTDAEIIALCGSRQFSTIGAVREALRRWGTPPAVAGGAVPLTCEWAHNENDGFWESACGEAWRFDDGGPAENSMHFCHSCGKSLRIKGGQHGTDT